MVLSLSLVVSHYWQAREFSFEISNPMFRPNRTQNTILKILLPSWTKDPFRGRPRIVIFILETRKPALILSFSPHLMSGRGCFSLSLGSYFPPLPFSAHFFPTHS